ncbi:MAG: UDP-3-O-(3-hydroxymyristoyl)glucosamine N-acyltransferase [Bacteroidetes bacterium]|nr:UDP-3-O-(3-hydroxymyristoyl)glucosamine N-acyltransferase [Bacteroidota bacterium]
MPKSKITVSQLAEKLGLAFKGNGQISINSVASLSSATDKDLCFVESNSYKDKLDASNCTVAIVSTDYNVENSNKTLLFSKKPHLSFVSAIHLLNTFAETPKIHSSVQMHNTAILGKNVSIEANTVVGENVKIEDNVKIGAGCVIEKDTSIGQSSRLGSNVTICHQVQIGNNVNILAGAVIGADGFGFIEDQGQWIKIPQLGSVLIGNDVEIGANTTIDRGALDNTIVGKGVKIDNQVQVAHNVSIGEGTAIAACVGIAGSAIIGANCKISGAAVVLGHLEVADDVTITAMSLVTKSIKHSGVYSSGTPLMENKLWHRSNARYKSLDSLAKTVSSMGNNK